MEKDEKAILSTEQKKDDIVLTPKDNKPQENNESLPSSPNEEKKRKKKKKKRDKKSKKKKEEEEEKEKAAKKTKKSVFSNEQFIINGNYNLIKMLGFGAFGEIHLAYDTAQKQLRAIKFEIASHKNPQLKHEFSILEQLNKVESGKSSQDIIGIPKVYGFDRMENKYNYMIMDFLGPSISDLYQLCEKKFSLETILMIGIQMLNRIEFIHEKGFIHRDIKPENFVIGINEKTNIVHIIDFGLSKRYKDKTSGQHIPYRENRHLVGTVRYASINAHLGIEQSRRDDIESIGYVLVYFFYGRLPWQNNGGDKGKPQANKIMEKKLITPPEILCKKMPSQFAYYFHYCKNLKFEDRPDYATLKTLFAELLYSHVKIGSVFTFDWFNDGKKDELNNSKSASVDNNLTLNNSGNASIFKNSNTPNPEILEQYAPNLYRDKYNINNGPSGITETLKIENVLKENGNSNSKGNPLGIIQDKTSESNSSDSVTNSDNSDMIDESKSKSEQKEDSSHEEKNKEKGSSDSYGILKSDSDKGN